MAWALGTAPRDKRVPIPCFERTWGEEWIDLFADDEAPL